MVKRRRSDSNRRPLPGGISSDSSLPGELTAYCSTTLPSRSFRRLLSYGALLRPTRTIFEIIRLEQESPIEGRIAAERGRDVHYTLTLPSSRGSSRLILS